MHYFRAFSEEHLKIYAIFPYPVLIIERTFLNWKELYVQITSIFEIQRKFGILNNFDKWKQLDMHVF